MLPISLRLDLEPSLEDVVVVVVVVAAAAAAAAVVSPLQYHPTVSRFLSQTGRRKWILSLLSPVNPGTGDL